MPGDIRKKINSTMTAVWRVDKFAHTVLVGIEIEETHGYEGFRYDADIDLLDVMERTKPTLEEAVAEIEYLQFK